MDQQQKIMEIEEGEVGEKNMFKDSNLANQKLTKSNDESKKEKKSHKESKDQNSKNKHKRSRSRDHKRSKSKDLRKKSKSRDRNKRSRSRDNHESKKHKKYSIEKQIRKKSKSRSRSQKNKREYDKFSRKRDNNKIHRSRSKDHKKLKNRSSSRDKKKKKSRSKSRKYTEEIIDEQKQTELVAQIKAVPVNEEALIEERRRKRQQLMEELEQKKSLEQEEQKSNESSDKEEVFQQNHNTEKSQQQKDMFKYLDILRSKQKEEGDDDDLDIEKIPDEDPQEEKKEESKKDQFDMFSDSPINLDDQIITNQVHNNLDFDDEEHYLKVQIGEILNKKYQVTQKCGKGVFSNVVKAHDLKTMQEVAIKILRSDEILIRAGEKEREIIQKLNLDDPNDKRHVIRLIASFEYRKHLCLVFESMDRDLRETLKLYGKKIGLSLEAVKSYTKQLFVALNHLRKNRIVHADRKNNKLYYIFQLSKDIALKGNLLFKKLPKLHDTLIIPHKVNQIYNLVDEFLYNLINQINYFQQNLTITIKLCDFGTSFPVEENLLVEYLQSRYYRAPEIMLGCPYDMAIDVWSAACTIYELYTGEFLFQGRNNNQMIKLIMQTKGKFNNRMLKKGLYANKYFDQNYNFLSQEVDPVSKQEYVKAIPISDKPPRSLNLLLNLNSENIEQQPELNLFKDFLEKCLSLEPNKRMTPEEALAHPFVNPYNQLKQNL